MAFENECCGRFFISQKQQGKVGEKFFEKI